MQLWQQNSCSCLSSTSRGQQGAVERAKIHLHTHTLHSSLIIKMMGVSHTLQVQFSTDRLRRRSKRKGAGLLTRLQMRDALSACVLLPVNVPACICPEVDQGHPAADKESLHLLLTFMLIQKQSLQPISFSANSKQDSQTSTWTQTVMTRGQQNLSDS